ncbi:hypothetical protein EX30DRAFT_342660 [Ascodesmis nigricans]|uniref:Orc1-like AAA ATPase domain-containing protein n=1 Tax=Ascodesmis nigricans TaxID=341454 RepID=A0A4S2MPT6_9PEZI|nr:hypothetical protein EX30DRAFT_342660 [Ascodesmis nigricans]
MSYAVYRASRQLLGLRSAARVQVRPPQYLLPRLRLNIPRCFTSSVIARAGNPLGPANDLQPQPGPQPVETLRELEEEDDEKKQKEGGVASTGTNAGKRGKSGGDGGGNDGPGTMWKMFESAATTAASIFVLGFAGYAYHKYYKYIVLEKIDNAFDFGDPALKIAMAGHDQSSADAKPWYRNIFSTSKEHDPGGGGPNREVEAELIKLDEQERINHIVNGGISGHYYLLIGEKGTGKTSMLLHAMAETGGESVSMMEAHADPEIFRIRLGKALDFEFHEDYVGSLFSFRGPRETTAILDIERALNKLEKVALVRRKATGRPLVMIINGMHMVRDDDAGKDLLELLQQRAEAWAAAGLVTMIFNSDDYWVYERMKQYGSRLELISVRDLTKTNALITLRTLRAQKCKMEGYSMDEHLFDKVYEMVGGRLAFLTKVAKSRDMIQKCEEICEMEKTWFLNKYWILGEGMDDDVMDQQKLASSACLLMKALVDLEQAQSGDNNVQPDGTHILPELPLHEARVAMTRADFIQQYDHDNVFTIDSRARVRADSVPMMNAFRQICGEDGFAQYLEETMERIGDIESLGRTRELTLKDLWNGGEYNWKVKDRKGNIDKTILFNVTRGHKGINGDDGPEGGEDKEEEEK